MDMSSLFHISYQRVLICNRFTKRVHSCTMRVVYHTIINKKKETSTLNGLYSEERIHVLLFYFSSSVNLSMAFTFK